jgi:hypothetical protein
MSVYRVRTLIPIATVAVMHVVSCKSKDQKTSTLTDTLEVKHLTDSSIEYEPPPGPMVNLPYIVDVNTRTITRNTANGTYFFQPDSVVKVLNAKYPNVKLEILKQSGDTLYTIIRDSEYLGERMGTTGAEDYHAHAVVNLTAIDGIKYVNISMEEHSHASPGVYSSKDFSSYKRIELPR